MSSLIFPKKDHFKDKQDEQQKMRRKRRQIVFQTNNFDINLPFEVLFSSYDTSTLLPIPYLKQGEQLFLITGEK